MNLGPTNMMVVRFNSDQYSTVSPGAGFVLTATAKPSGMCIEIKSDWLIGWLKWFDVFMKMKSFEDITLWKRL